MRTREIKAEIKWQAEQSNKHASAIYGAEKSANIHRAEIDRLRGLLAERKAKVARRWAWVWFVACVFAATELLNSGGLPWWRVFGGGFVVAMAGWAIHKTDKPKGGTP